MIFCFLCGQKNPFLRLLFGVLNLFERIKMLKSLKEALKTIGLGIFVNGAFALQFVEATNEALYAVIEGLVLVVISSIGKKSKERDNGKKEQK